MESTDNLPAHPPPHLPPHWGLITYSHGHNYTLPWLRNAQFWDLKGQGPQGAHRHFSFSVTPRVYVFIGYPDLHLLLLQPDLLTQPPGLFPKLTSPLVPSSPAIVQNPALGRSAHQPPGFPLCQEPEKKHKVVQGTHTRYGGWNPGITYSLCNLGQLYKFGSAGSSSIKGKNKMKWR